MVNQLSDKWSSRVLPNHATGTRLEHRTVDIAWNGDSREHNGRQLRLSELHACCQRWGHQRECEHATSA